MKFKIGQTVKVKNGVLYPDRLIDHIYIKRGRVYYQKSGVQLVEESKKIAEEKLKEWNTTW